MKRIILIVMILAMAFCSCEDKNVSQDAYGKNQGSQAQTTVTEKETETAETSKETSTSTVEMPTLPDIDFEGLTFKDDGYEIVELKSQADGDTANFLVGGMNMACRFLAIDTPETSGSSGIQPWGIPAKEYTKKALENAEVIILEKDLESDVVDKYGRLLAWVWVDGELLNYKLAEEGLGWVKYIYGDYKYVNEMFKVEAEAQKKKIKLWGEDDPTYDYDNSVKTVTIAEAKKLQAGSNVKITGVVTNYIGQNAFITDGTASVYIYANRYNYGALSKIGAEIELVGKIIEYNGLSEISSIEDNKITIISEGNEVLANNIVISDIGEDIEGDLVHLTDLTIQRVDISEGGGYSIVVSNIDDNYATIRIDKYLKDYPNPDDLKEGMVLDVVGSIGQHLDNYQIMIKDSEAITFR